jgi:DNA-binding MarR family transcriptional regulator
VAQIKEILADLSRSLGVPIVTPEYEIVLALVDCPGLTADKLIERSSLSRAGFFNTVHRLKNCGFIVSRPSPTDRRRKIYHLSEDMHDMIISRSHEYKSIYTRFMKHGIMDINFIINEMKERRKERMYYLSCEFQILFYINLIPRISNSHLRKLIDASDTKFSVSLRNLLKNGAVSFANDENDGRLKLYDIRDDIRKMMTNHHSDVFDWLDDVADRRA